MSKIKKDNTEEKILEAAKTVFIKKGMDGARMQEIANEAGINKALLHYYFRSKQKLFEAIFTNLFKQIFPNIIKLMTSEEPIEKKLKEFIENYIDILTNNPRLPAFILREINRGVDFFGQIFRSQSINPNIIFAMFENEMEKGNIVRMNPRDIMLNILSMCLFPFAAKPLMQLMLFENDSEAYTQFMEERKASVTKFVLNAILLKDKHL